MKKTTNNLNEMLLYKYIDGELDPDKVKDVEALLLLDIEAKEFVDLIKLQKTTLENQFNPILTEETPKFLLDTVNLGKKKSPTNKIYQLIFTSKPNRLAASFFVFTVGCLFGWSMSNLNATKVNSIQIVENNFVEQARLAHVMYTPEKIHPVDVDAKNEKHLVQWLSKRLGVKIKAPVLSAWGFNLVGGRLLPNKSGPSAQFMYEDSNGERLTLYVNNKFDKQETAFEYSKNSGISSFYWVDHSLVYALTGNITRKKLLNISHTIYKKFNPENNLPI